MAGGACATEGADSPWPSLVMSFILSLIAVVLVSIAFCALVEVWAHQTLL
jgi:Na+-transporting NADH:ubiquinone oxidoreductase subunit NqrC